MSRLNLEGLNEEEREEVVAMYDDFLDAQAEDFVLRKEERTAPITER